MPHTKKHKRIIATTGDEYASGIEKDLEAIQHLYQDLAAMNAIGWLAGDAENLMAQISMAQADIVAIKEDEKASDRKFEEAQKILMEKEGGYNDGKYDKKGGETYKGISRKQNGNWEGWPYIDNLKKQGFHLKYNQVIDNAHLDSMLHKFYRENFWDKMHGSEIKDQNLAKLLYNDYVNINHPIIDSLQKILHVKQSAGIGVETLNAINAYDGGQLLDSLHSKEQNYYYHSSGYLPDKKEIPGHIVTQTEQEYRDNSLDGWINRSNDLYNRLKSNERQNKTSVQLINNNNVQTSPKNTSNDVLTYLFGYGVPGDSDYVPSVFDGDYYFNEPEGRGQEQKAGGNAGSYIPALFNYDSLPEGRKQGQGAGGSVPSLPIHGKGGLPAPAKGYPPPFTYDIMGSRGATYNITIEKITGQQIGTQNVHGAGSKIPVTGDMVAGVLREAVISG